MKLNARLVNGIIVSVLLLVGCGVGWLVGRSSVSEYNPAWEKYSLKSVPSNAAQIKFVEIKSYLFDPTGDIVYVADNDGNVYSNTVFQNEWSMVSSIPEWENKRPDNCTSERLGPTESHLWDNPPVAKGIKDSAGVIFERPVSTIVRCYVLLDDGSIEVWVHSGNAMDSMAGEFLKLLFAFFGLIIGIIISVIVVRYRKRAASLPA